MAIRFKDFTPLQTEQDGFIFSRVSYGSLETAVQAANQWIDEHQIRLINVETLLLPEMHSTDDSTDARFSTSGDMSSAWFQFVRVWYQSDRDHSSPTMQPPETA